MKHIDAFKKFALSVPQILLPANKSKLSSWAVIACDQYTQDREYWDQVAKIAGTDPSTLRIILPEVYLDDSDRAQRLADIRAKMDEYLTGGVFAKPVEGFVYIERKTAYRRTRRGLVVAIDLDAYDWKPESKAPIRATEATIVERIPPRMEIRRGAPLESPHIMLLVNDPERNLIEGTGSRVRTGQPLYATELMTEAGYITGWQVSSDLAFEHIAKTLERLAQAGTEPDGSRFLYAVGDGNHSLATAKAVWDEFRAAHAADAAAGKIDLDNHPARYALVELVNLYDEGLTFEPIHRVLFGTDRAKLADFVAKKMGGKLEPAADEAKVRRLVEAKDTTRFGFVSADGMSVLDTPNPALAVSRLQPVLDEFLAANPSVKIDYVHGAESVFGLGAEPNAVSILLPPVEKDSFFSTIASGGPLPRKSFSMGEASEKRFYLECRALF
jgi:hypothetical protein